MPVFDSDGTSIHYEVFGEGPPVVLVHGFASNLRDNWELTGWVKRLVDAGRRVIALDCRGHGESDKPHAPDAYGGQAMSEDVIRLMDKLHITRADLFGYSMGGAISLDLLTRHPECFRRVVLGGYGNVLGSTELETIAAALSSEDASEVSDPTARLFRWFAESRGDDLKALAACLRGARAESQTPQLARVDLPVLLAVGEKDNLAVSDDSAVGADVLAAAIPGARLVTIPDRDHLTMVPDPRFKEAVLAFLAEERFE